MERTYRISPPGTASALTGSLAQGRECLISCGPIQESGTPMAKSNRAPSAKSKSDDARTKKGAIVPTVTFRHMDASETIELAIGRYTQKLNRVFARIVWCRAIVERSTAHHRKGNVYRVELDIQVPGQTISAASAKRRAYDHEDLRAAVREAFAAGTRQLQDFAKRRSSATAQERRSSSLRSQRADSE
jgi:ribosome-associated translation inhibitor RaiA